MKKNLLSIAVLLFAIVVLPSKTFAQDIPGGSSSESGTIDQGQIMAATITDPASLPKCSSLLTFKRNNGNGWGVCGSQSQLRITTTQMSNFPDLVQMTDGKNYHWKGLVSGSSDAKGYVSYCQPDNNMSPATKLTLVFATQTGGCTTSE